MLRESVLHRATGGLCCAQRIGGSCEAAHHGLGEIRGQIGDIQGVTLYQILPFSKEVRGAETGNARTLLDRIGNLDANAARMAKSVWDTTRSRSIRIGAGTAKGAKRLPVTPAGRSSDAGHSASRARGRGEEI